MRTEYSNHSNQELSLDLYPIQIIHRSFNEKSTKARLILPVLHTFNEPE